MSRECVRTPAAWDKLGQIVVELVKCLPSFGVKGQCNLQSIVISPGSSVNGKQADVNMREHLLRRHAMQFSKSLDRDQVSGQRACGRVTFPRNGRAFSFGCTWPGEYLLF